MPSFLRHAALARPSSPTYDPSVSPRTFPDDAIAGEIHSCAPPDGEERASGALHDAGDDYWAAEIDLVILRTADHLRRAGVELPDVQLRRVAEEVVLGAAHFVLDWVERPRSGVSPPALGARAAPLPPVEVRSHAGA